MWRAKFADEISQNISEEFSEFIEKARTTVSEDTGIIYYYSHLPYKYADVGYIRFFLCPRYSTSCPSGISLFMETEKEHPRRQYNRQIARIC